MVYNFAKVEKKWQKKWEEEKIFEVREGKKKKYYILEMYPYPSGSGLHMGHAFNYTIGDIFARFKRMNGFNVLYPMGYDSFGLPAENAAIKAKSHPKKFTEDAIKNFIKQQKSLGLSYDWSRMVQSHDPSYYKWDQWIFLKMLEKGLAYRKKAPVNWCPKCNTVLANEQVHNGKCWRHEDTEVEVKHLEQWFFKITDYADELYEGINDLKGWAEDVKTMQKNWIGKSYGTEIDFEIETGKNEISNVVIVHAFAPNKTIEEKNSISQNLRAWRGWVRKELERKGISCYSPLMPNAWNPKYSEWKNELDKINLNENSILVGHSAGGAFLVRYLSETKKKIKKLILISPGKSGRTDKKELFDLYGKDEYNDIKSLVRDEIVIFTSEGDHDYHVKIAHEYEKEIGARVVKLGKGFGHFSSSEMKSNEFPELLEEVLSVQKIKFPVFTTRPDTIFGVTFMVVSAQHTKLMELVTEEQKKDVEKFLKKIKSTKQEDIDMLEKEGVFTGSYAINPLTNEKIPIWVGNFVVADYGSGMVMAVPAHDKRDFDFAKKYNLKIKQVIQSKGKKINCEKQSYEGSGILINSGKFNGLENNKAKWNITQFLEAEGKGRKTTQYKLKDWLVSRQRFWGTPIPVIYCEKCGIVPVPEKDLPVKLPENIKFTSEKNPLKNYEKFVNVKCPKCGGKAKRETDTMDTFVNSSWYFLRYCDPKNSRKIFDSKKVNYWMPIDTYIGGKEHACMHLIYFRFYTKFLRDSGLLNFDEPTYRQFNQGMLHGPDGAVMSKSRGNVVSPEEVSKKYGIDTARLFLVSVASPDKDIVWSEGGINGTFKFIQKVLNYFENLKLGKSDARTESKLHKAILEISYDIENFRYNLAVIKLRNLFDSFPESISRNVAESFLKLLHPFCPHITEELWEKIGNKNFISLEKWPVANKKKINEEFEKQEEAIGGLVGDILNIGKIVEAKGEVKENVFVYVIPSEKDLYSEAKERISKKTNLKIQIFAVNDKNKYDPESKSKKAKPGKPAIYLE